MLDKLKSLDKQKYFLVILASVAVLSIISLFSKTAYTVIFYIAAICIAVFYAPTEIIVFWLVCVFFEQTNSVLALPLLVLMLGISVLKDAIQIKFKFNKNIIFPIILTLGMIIMCFAVNFNKTYYKEVLSYVAILVLGFEFFYLRGNFDFEKIVKLGTIILLTSCIFSFFMQFAKGFGFYHGDNSGLKRFIGLTTHENMLATYAIMFMSFNVLLYFKGKLKLSVFIVFEIALFACGMFTLSKAFLILFAVLAILYFIKSFIINKKSAAIQLGSVVVFAALFIAIFHSKVASIFSRFSLYYQNSGFLNMITTGRWSIWTWFYWMWCSKLSNLFIGLGASFRPYEYVHNFYLDLVFKFGVIGFIAIFVLVIYYFNFACKNKKFKFENFIPISIALANMFIEVFIAKRIIVVFIAIIGLFYLTEKAPAQEQKNVSGDAEVQKLEENK